MPFFSFNQFPLFSSDIVFFNIDHAEEKDAIVLVHPLTSMWLSPIVFRCTKPIEEQIDYIRENNIKKAFVVAEDISFLRQCPSLEYLQIIPSNTAKAFDYSPLYDLPNVRFLNCTTVFGERGEKHATIDYSRLPNLEYISVEEKGHLNYNSLKKLKVLSMGAKHPGRDELQGIFQSECLQAIILCQTRVCSLNGIENAPQIKRVSLSYNRKLTDISALEKVKDSLIYLDIEACGGIKDYSVLHKLHNLEYLSLGANIVLPDLSFLKGMPNLKVFWFLGNTQDGDVSMCDNIPKPYFRNHRHYNRNNEAYRKLPFPDDEALRTGAFLRV